MRALVPLALLEFPPHPAAERNGVGVVFVVLASLVASQVLQLPRRGAGIGLGIIVVAAVVAPVIGIGRAGQGEHEASRDRDSNDALHCSVSMLDELDQ